MNSFLSFEKKAYQWMAANGIVLLRISIGLVFFWFGIQKYFPGMSSAEELAMLTVSKITFGLIHEALIMPILATWEVLIGLTFITGYFMRIALPLLFLQMIGTFMPLFLFPAESFVPPPFIPTLVGQYIIKNIVIVTGAMVIGAYYQGGITIKRNH